MRRREFIAVLSGAAVWPLATRAQHPPRKIPRIGWLAPGTAESVQESLEEYRRGMRERGYVEGRTIETKYLYADGQLDRLPQLATMLVADKVDVIVTAGTLGCLAAKQATTVIPIVFAVVGDPLAPASSPISAALMEISPGYRSWPRI